MEASFQSLTAADLMSRNLLLIPRDMSLEGAARMLSRANVSGAPVVDEKGRCVGVLSGADFLHCVERGGQKHKPHGAEAVCSWQLPEGEEAAEETVRDYMTDDPVLASFGTSIGELCQRMLDAHIHRLIIVDHDDRPIGVVSTTDILAAVVRETRKRARAEASPAPVVH